MRSDLDEIIKVSRAWQTRRVHFLGVGSVPPIDSLRPERDEIPDGGGDGPAPSTERELDLLGPPEVAVNRVVDVEADAAVQVLGGMHHPLGAFGRPELGDGERLSAASTLGSATRPGDAVSRMASVSM